MKLFIGMLLSLMLLQIGVYRSSVDQRLIHGTSLEAQDPQSESDFAERLLEVMPELQFEPSILVRHDLQVRSLAGFSGNYHSPYLLSLISYHLLDIPPPALV